MPLQNRVDPHGQIVATPERGLFFGNRGCIHRPDGSLKGRLWAVTRWIVCLTTFRGRRHPLAAPGRYTGLFFLDEATALAAGHRPCYECRRADALRFREAWLRGQGRTEDVSFPDLDLHLHGERLDARGRQQTFDAPLSALPTGVMVDHPSGSGAPHLWWNGLLLPWSFGGYAPADAHDPSTVVRVVTPRSTVAALEAGYRPVVHPSASTPTS